MNRRKFIILSLFTVVSAMVVSLFAVYDFETVVFKMLQHDLAFLKVRESDFTRFIQEARGSNYWNRIHMDKKKRAFVILYFLLPNVGLPYQFKYVQLRGLIVGNFLLSTDFFQNKMNEEAPITYIALFDPEITPCQNPFSNLFYS